MGHFGKVPVNFSADSIQSSVRMTLRKYINDLHFLLLLNHLDNLIKILHKASGEGWGVGVNGQHSQTRSPLRKYMYNRKLSQNKLKTFKLN